MSNHQIGVRLLMPLAWLIGSTALAQMAVVLPVPLRTQRQTPTGDTVAFNGDVSFIHPGSTTYEEIARTLAEVSFMTEDRRLFWGRWHQSRRWGVFTGFAAGEGGAGKTFRYWRDVNLLIEFDQNGIVERSRVLPDEKMLGALWLWVKAHREPLALPSPITLPMLYVRNAESDPGTAAQLQLGAHSVKLLGSGFEFAPESANHLVTRKDAFGFFDYCIIHTEQTELKDRWCFTANESLLTVIQYFDQFSHAHIQGAR